MHALGKEIDAASDLDRLKLVIGALSLVDETLMVTEKWTKAYNRRTSGERVNSRLDQVLGFEHHTIRGKAKMEMRVTLAQVVMLAMALGRILIGQPDIL